MAKLHPNRRYSPADIAKITAMRASGIEWREIGAHFRVGMTSVQNAFYNHVQPAERQVADPKPKPWPRGVDFAPDELQVGHT